MKWWKAEKYGTSTNDHEVPPSIALTLLVCEHFEMSKIGDDYNDLSAFYKTVKNIIDSIFYDGYNSDGEPIKKLYSNACKLPKQPNSDCFIKLRKSDAHIQKFYNKLNYLEEKLQKACNETDERKAGEEVVRVLGDKFPLPEKDKVNKEDSFA